MPAHIVHRKSRTYHVRYRVGGRESRLRHAGSFPTLAQARARKKLVDEQLAATGHFALEPESAQGRALQAAVSQWLAARIDLKPGSIAHYRRMSGYIVADFAGKGIHLDTQLTPPAVAGWVAGMSAAGAKRATIRQKLNILQQVLDHCGIDPNPARHATIRLPHEDETEITPPTTRQFQALLERCPAKYRTLLSLLEATGLRIGEALALRWTDLDVSKRRVRVRGGKTRAARRFVGIPATLWPEIDELCAPEDRLPERLIFPALNQQSIRTAMTRACRAAGVPQFSPHDLRHRYISKLVQAGVPITQVRVLAGHAKASMTLDVYAHVLIDD